MTGELFTLREGVSTREVLSVVRAAQAQALNDWVTYFPNLTASVERRRTRPYVAPGVRGEDVETRYVFGIESPVRSTLLGHFVVGSGEIMVCKPNGYRSWDTANQYDRLRIRMRDLIIHHADIRDKSLPARGLF